MPSPSSDSILDLLGVTTPPAAKAIVLDSSITFALSRPDCDLLKKHTEAGRIQVWDSPLGLFEIVRHINQPDCKLGDKVGWAKSRCALLGEIAPNHMLPHPGLVVRRAIRKFLSWDRDDGALKNEIEHYLSLRKSLVLGHRRADSPELVQELVLPMNATSQAFCGDLDILRADLDTTELKDLRKKVSTDMKLSGLPSVTPDDFRAAIVSKIQEDVDWQRSLFLEMLRHHGVGDWEKGAVALHWKTMPYLQTLMAIYRHQVARFAESGRAAVLEDFIDYEWAAYIASERIHYFVTNNTRDFQKAFADEPSVAPKVRTWADFRLALESGTV